MSAALILQLLAQFGPPALSLVTTLIQKAENNQPVTAAEWATLSASLQQTAAQRMTAALTTAGIDPASAQGQTLLALTK